MPDSANRVHSSGHGGRNQSVPGTPGRCAAIGFSCDQPVPIDTFAGRVHIDWDPDASVTPSGQMAFFMSSNPVLRQRSMPTLEKSDEVLDDFVAGFLEHSDANDMLYYFASSRNYDPAPHLDQVTAPVLAINSADDFVNPPELGIAEKLIARVKNAKFVMVPISDQTHGHGTHSWPAVWQDHLKAFLATLPER